MGCLLLGVKGRIRCKVGGSGNNPAEQLWWPRPWWWHRGEKCSDSRNIFKAVLVPMLGKWEMQLALELAVVGPCSCGVRVCWLLAVPPHLANFIGPSWHTLQGPPPTSRALGVAACSELTSQSTCCSSPWFSTLPPSDCEKISQTTCLS